MGGAVAGALLTVATIGLGVVLIMATCGYICERIDMSKWGDKGD